LSLLVELLVLCDLPSFFSRWGGRDGSVFSFLRRFLLLADLQIAVSVFFSSRRGRPSAPRLSFFSFLKMKADPSFCDKTAGGPFLPPPPPFCAVWMGGSSLCFLFPFLSVLAAEAIHPFVFFFPFRRVNSGIFFFFFCFSEWRRVLFP